MLGLRNRLYDDLLGRWEGTCCDGALVAHWRHALERLLPGASAEALQDSLRPLLGLELTDEALRQLSWRLAGNLTRLRQGLAVTPWAVQSEIEWVPLEVEAARPESRPRRGQRERGHCYRMVALAGTPAGLRLETFWPDWLLRPAARRLGFQGRRGRLGDGVELVQLRLFGLVEPGLSHEAPGFRTIGATQAVRRYNQAILLQRLRVGFVCPRRYEHPCRLCPVGYEECPVAVRPTTLVRAVCGCGAGYATGQDPFTASERCPACQARRP